MTAERSSFKWTALMMVARSVGDPSASVWTFARAGGHGRARQLKLMGYPNCTPNLTRF